MRRCFVISPIGSAGTSVRENADAVFEFIIAPALKELDIEPVRADKLSGPGLITEQMIAAIVDYDFCIADLSGHNPNVFYELALAQAAERPVVLLKLQGEPVPFDVKDYRLIEYDLRPHSLKTDKWIPVLQEHVRVVLKEGYQPPKLLRDRQLVDTSVGRGLDLSRVTAHDGTLSTHVADCEIRIINGRIEDYAKDGSTVVLPCNEYFDDRCAGDTKSALGAYVNAVFQGRVQDFIALITREAAARFGAGTKQEKTSNHFVPSFGIGRCLLLTAPLGGRGAVALVSTTTQRAGEGLSSRISYLFDGMRALVEQLADERISDVVMPLMGAGHGGLEKPLALVGLLLAIAEVAHYGRGSQRLRQVTIVVFRPDPESKPEVDPVVARRALALIGQ